MERFLSRCAKYIFEKHTNELHEICLVFPNRRAGVFFNAYLQKQLSAPVIGPKIITVNELISGYSRLHQGEKLQLISILYDIFQKHTQTSESFDDFYFWGEVLLADFNDIDNYLVNAKDLFTNLSDLKEIEGLFDYMTPEQKAVIERFWGSLAGTGQKSHHEKFISIWQNLYPVYAELKEVLQEKEMAYGGMISRAVIEKFRNEELQFEFKKNYIIGLNALNNCEKAFFNLMKQQQKIEFLWDYDSFYIDDKINEAGRFIRENLKQFPPPEDFTLDTLQFSEKKNIKLVAVSSNYGQAQEIPRFFEEIKSGFEKEFDNTAVVLADESLLYPALGAIPSDVGKVNITMGYPVKNSVVYGFLLLLVNLLKNRRKNNEGRFLIYHRYLTDILNHQLLGNIEPEKATEFLIKLKDKNQITVPLDEVNFSQFHRLIFSTPENVKDFSPWFLEILNWFYEIVRENDTENKLLQELIYSIYQAIEKLNSVISDVVLNQRREISDAVFFRLFGQYLGQVAVAFEGEPLSGMQVMGILETRCLDFENLIILGLNENKWPRTFTAPSFIPFSLRKGFGLPGIDEQDAMYAYYFYRLTQRAKNVTATYSTLKEGIGTGELSRYGFQLLYDSGLDVRKSTLDFKFSNEPVLPVEILGSPEKSATLLNRISNEKPLSPTAINTWLQCSLRFYFRYILKLPEPDEMKDEIDSPVFGSIFHEVVENLYKPFEGKMVNKVDLEKISKNKVLIENEIRKAIGKHYFRQKDPTTKTVKLEGKTILIYENTKTFIQRVLEIDMQQTPFKLVSLEGDYQASLEISLNGKQISVRIGGKIDRVDMVNDTLRILDYKTGNVDSFSFKELDELFEKDKEKPKKEILQALIYCLIYRKNTCETTDLQPGIYSLRKLFDENFSPEIKRNFQTFSFQEIEEEFTAQLQILMAEMLSESGRFYQTPHEKFCQYCPYNRICQKY
ncbi:MAG: PD-(D/E)XK nuclease family protein [Mariniphaga sp.]|nr:PD-(D/E)XK nuclease family protein [Mariniphaga sp.]